MTSFTTVLDSYALIAYLQKEQGSHRVIDFLENARQEKCALMLSLVNWGEIYYSVFRTKGEKFAQECLLLIEQLPIQLIDIDRDLVYQAARFKSYYSIAYADCFAAALAKRENCALLTGDREFQKLQDEIVISWM